MSTFQREDRYLVLKQKDILHLSAAHMQQLQDVCTQINVIRADRGKGGIECVVVESDWPEYQHIWALLEARVTGSDYPHTATTTAGQCLQAVCHGASRTAGWWRQGDHDLVAEIRAGKLFGKALFAQKLCLIHSEVSEAMEGHRKSLMDDKLPHRPMAEVELADALIRIFDLAGAMGYDLGGAITEKLAFNAQRPDHKPEARSAAGGKAY